jgi:hypothetical protein
MAIKRDEELFSEKVKDSKLYDAYERYLESKEFTFISDNTDDLFIVKRLKVTYPGLGELISLEASKDHLKVIEVQILHQILCEHIFLEDDGDITCIHCGFSTKSFDDEDIKSTLTEIFDKEKRVLRGIPLKYKDIVKEKIEELTDDQVTSIELINREANYKILSKTLGEVLKQKTN